MNNKWLPWILTTLVTLALGYVTYSNTRFDKVSDVQAAMHKEYIPRIEYDKDYKSFCERLNKIDIKVEGIDDKLDRLLAYAKRNNK